MRIRLSRVLQLIFSLGPFGRVAFVALLITFAASALGTIYFINTRLMVEIPAHGGTYTEGIVGTPRFINPLLAISSADRDLAALVYAGLLKTDPNGSLIPALASGYDVSADGTVYTVYIRPDARFQDHTPVTADDVVFTVSKAQDPALKSPLRANWQGIAASVIDSHTVRFILPKPYAPFTENLTLGILPKHLWQGVSASEFPFSTLNEQPVGAGPYQIDTVAHDASGLPNTYKLSAFSDYELGEPFITHITLNCYANEDALVAALRGGDVMGGGGISPANLSKVKGMNVVSISLNRVFGVFFNQNQSAVLRDRAVRVALNTAVDKWALVNATLGGYAEPLDGPIPPAMLQTNGSGAAAGRMHVGNLTAAKSQLIADGWQPDANGVLQKTAIVGKTTQTQPLSFTISTGNIPELVTVANYLKQQWAQIGVQATVAVYEPGDLSENAIRPRKYDALLFGEVIGRGVDLFAFWDSSQRNDPGLNIALYANSSVDALLAKVRNAPNDAGRAAWYTAIDQQIIADVPAVFLYAPEYVYVLPNTIHGATFGVMEDPSDRFATISQWYMRTDHVWPIFVHTASTQ